MVRVYVPPNGVDSEFQHEEKSMSRTKFIAVIENETGDHSTSRRHRYWSPETALSKFASTDELLKAQRRVTIAFEEYLPDDQSGFLVWQFDDTDQPAVFVTGLLGLREGWLTQEEFDAWENDLRPQIMSQDQVEEPAIAAGIKM